MTGGDSAPGELVERNEDLVTALEREVLEESNCEIAVWDLAGVCSNLGRREEGVPEQAHLTFRCRWLQGNRRAGDGCVDAGWFSFREAMRLVTVPQQRDKLLDAMTQEAGVRYRAFRTRAYEPLLERKLA